MGGSHTWLYNKLLKLFSERINTVVMSEMQKAVEGGVSVLKTAMSAVIAGAATDASGMDNVHEQGEGMDYSNDYDFNSVPKQRFKAATHTIADTQVSFLTGSHSFQNHDACICAIIVGRNIRIH